MKQYEKIVKISGILKLTLILFFIIFLIINLISSQNISSIYFKFVDNDRSATISFLQKIVDLPDYQNILKMNDNIFGQTIKTAVYAEKTKKRSMINKLEHELIINPKARDILYSLYQLYLAEGDKDQANNYLKRAKEVDPSIN